MPGVPLSYKDKDLIDEFNLPFLPKRRRNFFWKGAFFIFFISGIVILASFCFIRYVQKKESSLPLTHQILYLKNPHPDFVGREDYLNILKEAFLPSNTRNHLNDQTKVKVLWGLGGLGKSELAIQFANTHRECFSLIWVLHAEKKELLDGGYRDLAEALGLSIEKNVMIEAVKRRVHTFLEQNPYEKPWLLIFDNTEIEISDEALPQRGGCILITSREGSVRRNEEEHIKLSPFSSEEAVALLKKVTKEEKSKDMEVLIKELGYFPFAINQVGHYIRETPGSTIASYRLTYNLKQEIINAPISKDPRYTYTLRNIWGITFGKLKEEIPEVIRWLEVCAYLDPDNIPVSWLESFIQDKGVSEAVLRNLERFALMRYNREEKAFSIHRLMQEVLQVNQREKSGLNEPFAEAFRLVFESREFQTTLIDTWNRAKKWFPHAVSVMSRKELLCEMPSSDQVNILYQMGEWSLIEGRYREANEYFEECLSFQTYLAGNVCLFLSILKERGNVLTLLSRYEEALTDLTKALQICIKNYGEVHPDTSEIMNNLGWTLSERGKYREALNYYQKALEVCFKTYGENHSQSATVLGNMGWNYMRLGENKKGLEYIKRAWEIFVKLYGEEHPLVHRHLISLAAGQYFLAQNYLALENLEKALEISKKFYSKSHPYSGIPLINRGKVLRSQGRFQQALEEDYKALNVMLLSYEKKHLMLAYCYSNIGTDLEKLGRYKEGIIYHQKALEMLPEFLDEDSPDVAKFLKRYGNCLFGQGRVEEALVMQERALKILKNCFDGDHPLIGEVLRAIGICYLSQREYKKAMETAEACLIIRKKFYEAEHPQIAKAYSLLGDIQSQQGKLEEALDRYQKACVISCKAYGKDSYYPVLYLDKLVKVLYQLNDPALVEEVKKAIYPLAKETLGSRHHLVRNIRPKDSPPLWIDWIVDVINFHWSLP